MRRRTFVIAASICAVVGVTIGGALVAAAGRNLDASNRFAPSGMVSVDPLSTLALQAGKLRRLGPSPPRRPSTTSGGCVDSGEQRTRQPGVHEPERAGVLRALPIPERDRGRREPAEPEEHRREPERLSAGRRHLRHRLEHGRREALGKHACADRILGAGFHRPTPLLGCGRRHVGRVRQLRRGLPDVPGVQPRRHQRPRRQRQRASSCSARPTAERPGASRAARSRSATEPVRTASGCSTRSI